MTLLLVALPLRSDRASMPSDPLRLPGAGFGVATKATCPVGAPVALEPADTLVLIVIGVPCAMPLIELTLLPFTLALRVVVDWERLTEDQLFTRFCALTDPSPVAMSYPVVVIHASVVEEDGATKTPLLLEVETLQLGVPPLQGTLFVPTPGRPVGKSLFPFVTSLKIQVEASAPLHVQLAPAFLAKA